MNQTIKTTPSCSIRRAYEKPAMHIIPLDAEAVMAASTDYGVTDEGGYNGPVYNPKRFWNSTSLSLGEEDEPQ